MACRISNRWNSTFARFVQAYGAARLAKGLEVHPTAIYQWVRGVTSPYIAHAVIIRRLARKSGVKLTLDEIYSHSFDLRGSERESGVQSLYAARHASRKGAKSSRISRVNPGIKPTGRARARETLRSEWR